NPAEVYGLIGAMYPGGRGHGIIIVILKVPADQIIDLAVGILIRAVSPARVVEKVATVDVAVTVQVDDKWGVGCCVEVTKGDPSVGVRIRQACSKPDRDFTLVEPDIQVNVWVGVINTTI